MTPNWNSYFRRIRASHQMDKHDVVEACRLGGLEVSASRAESWSRGVQGQDAERGKRRSIAMTEAEFEAFTNGLPLWARETYQATRESDGHS